LGKKEDDNEDELKEYKRTEDVKSRTDSNRDELVKATTSEERDQIIKKQKQNRSPGEDNIILEMFIHACLELKESYKTNSVALIKCEIYQLSDCHYW
jgi:hypothetical protein